VGLQLIADGAEGAGIDEMPNAQSGISIRYDCPKALGIYVFYENTELEY
jgi:hypothetical protein